MILFSLFFIYFFPIFYWTLWRIQKLILQGFENEKNIIYPDMLSVIPSSENIYCLPVCSPLLYFYAF